MSLSLNFILYFDAIAPFFSFYFVLVVYLFSLFAISSSFPSIYVLFRPSTSAYDSSKSGYLTTNYESEKKLRTKRKEGWAGKKKKNNQIYGEKNTRYINKGQNQIRLAEKISSFLSFSGIFNFIDKNRLLLSGKMCMWERARLMETHSAERGIVFFSLRKRLRQYAWWWTKKRNLLQNPKSPNAVDEHNEAMCVCVQ